MRKTRLGIIAVGALAVVGCEDGPKQTFQTAPKNAANAWNDGQTPPTASNAGQGFVGRVGGTTAQQICTGEERAQRWAEMVQQPMCPPTTVAGINAVGGPGTKPGDACPDPQLTTWSGMTIEQAERGYTDSHGTFHQGNCQSTSMGDFFGDGSLVNSWGDNNEVQVKYVVSTHRVQWFTVNLGYEGKLIFHSRPNSRFGDHTYVIKLGEVIQRDGQNFLLNWDDSKDFDAKATELADGLFATFSPEVAPETGSCFNSGHCTKTVFSDQAALRIWPMGMHLWVDQPHLPQPTPSRFKRIDFRLPRIIPSTFAATTLKLDAEGPVASTAHLNDTPACRVTLGMTYRDYISTCIAATQDMVANDIYMRKFTGDMAHNTERFLFDASGVDLNFTATKDTLQPFDVLRDDSKPADLDIAASFYVDAGTLGFISNDRAPDGSLDLHGAGLVYLEYARLVQATINAGIKRMNPNAVTHELGDPACLFPANPPSGWDPSTFHYAPNCTGFEGFLTAASPTANPQFAKNALGIAAAKYLDGIGIRCGKPLAVFCMDPGGLDAQGAPVGYNYCGAHDVYGMQGAIWDFSFQRVTQVLGGGDVDKLPPEARDRRFFWQQYVTALMKYLKVAGMNDANGNPDIAAQSAAIHSVVIDPNALFFDAEGSGQYEVGEYIDRGTDPTKPPVDLQVSGDILNGTFYSYQFQRTLYRPEEALYTVLRKDPTQALGQQLTATLTNLFGSPVLQSLPYFDHMYNGQLVTAYECAAADWHTLAEYNDVAARCGCAGDPNACVVNGKLPPLDPSYQPNAADPTSPPVTPLREGTVPLYTYYPSNFGKTHDAKGDDVRTRFSPFEPKSSHIKVTTKPEWANLQMAQIDILGHADPYDPTTATATTSVFVPWTPMQSGNGFLFPVSGTRDKLVETASLNFSGVTVTINLDYFPRTSGIADVVAMETVDFLGDVFLCRDPLTGDILRTKMYGSVQTILDWIQTHPGVIDACGLIIRYSPFNNFPDFIFSTANGVRVNTTSGGGYGRVVDATLFVPGSYGSSN